ncbi:hypothetical protein OPT61_g6143 [Boeremia exigua]|uniref:Uncharacterized protein n=1 Tax=Boeremia exigua TaxID=749465 RepID=A0ACC2I7Q9_9PLEO|nr:hypothetical protein OPT61_g6143 [Boeremia exigua]
MDSLALDIEAKVHVKSRNSKTWLIAISMNSNGLKRVEVFGVALNGLVTGLAYDVRHIIISARVDRALYNYEQAQEECNTQRLYQSLSSFGKLFTVSIATNTPPTPTKRQSTLIPTNPTMRVCSILSLVLPTALLHTASANPVAPSSEIEPENAKNPTLVARRECGSGARAECVTYYSGAGCSGALGHYAPDCTGHCFQYDSFSSLKTVGGGFPANMGTACKVFSDSNCQNQIADLGNNANERCGSFSKAKTLTRLTSETNPGEYCILSRRTASRQAQATSIWQFVIPDNRCHITVTSHLVFSMSIDQHQSSSATHQEIGGKERYRGTEMPEFFSLPRELRDMIYTSVITWSLPQPRREDTDNHRWRHIREPESIQSGEYGCSYSTDTVPGTCANLLVCNRQINHELKQAIERAKRRGLLVAKLDCIATDESRHSFSWLSLPIVTNKLNEDGGRTNILATWAERILSTPQRMLNLGSKGSRASCSSLTTILESLWVDIRIHGNRTAKWSWNQGPPERTSWAVCAALKRLFDGDTLMRPINASSASGHCSSNITIDELVLNIVSLQTPKNLWLPEDYPLDVATYGVVHPQTVAKEFLDLWNTIWTGDDFKGAHYRVLLERIKRVKICVDGQIWRVRELGMELERGQAERRRIAMRGVW